SDPRRRSRHQARALRPDPCRRCDGPLLRLVHDRNRRALPLRSRLCLSRAEGRRRHEPGRPHGGAPVACLLRGGLSMGGVLALRGLEVRRFAFALIALALVLATVFWFRPNVASYNGLRLLLNLSPVLVFT